MTFWQLFKEQAAVIREKDPAIHSVLEVFLYSSFRAQWAYQRAHRHYLKGHYLLARWISQRAARKTGIEIHPGATIGRRLFIDHGAGVVIGETTEIGNDVTLYQGVTLGGTGKEKGKRHPTIKDGVLISAGALVLGSFTVGEYSRIGAGSVVLAEVPPHCTAVGVPARIVKYHSEEEKPAQNLDQINIPDPYAADLQEIHEEMQNLQQEILQEMRDGLGI
ncbi:MAG: serine O-acetyltransferase [Firmicutes bacterium]|nr:serine O-acetyltransferase [Bacillota bacterium]